MAAALAGLGAIQTLNFMVLPGIERGELVPILTNGCPPALDIYIAYAPSRQLSGKVRVFIDWVTELYRGVDVPRRS